MVFDENYERNNAPTTTKGDLGHNNMRGTIILDSGASCHMFNSNTLMSEYRNLNCNNFKITGFNGSSESAIGIGNIGILKGFLYIKNIPKSIISTTVLSNWGYNIFQSNSESYVMDSNGKIILRGTFNGKLWIIEQRELVEQLNIGHNINLSSTMRNDPISMLHYKYNH